jgi:hypothetical protein
MKMLASYLSTAVAAALLLAAGTGHGLWTNRWGPSQVLDESRTRLSDSNIPKVVGDWVGEDPPPEENRLAQMAQADVTGHLVRIYTNRRTGDTLSVMILSGLPGPIASHTPQICYAGAGFDLVPPPGKYEIKAGDLGPGAKKGADFYVGDFKKVRSIVPAGLRIFWSWSENGTWRITSNPRRTFVHAQCLYKIYVIRQTTGPGANPGEVSEVDPSARFLEAFMPALQQALFAPLPTSAAPATAIRKAESPAT